MENQWLEPTYSCVFGFFQCVLKESLDKTGVMVLKGVSATVLDKENGNGRRYWPPWAAKDGAKTNVRKDVIPGLFNLRGCRLAKSAALFRIAKTMQPMTVRQVFYHATDLG